MLIVLIQRYLLVSVVYMFHCYAPAMIMAGALSVTSVRPSVLYSKSNNFDQNFMKLGHIV